MPKRRANIRFQTSIEFRGLRDASASHQMNDQRYEGDDQEQVDGSAGDVERAPREKPHDDESEKEHKKEEIGDESHATVRAVEVPIP